MEGGNVLPGDLFLALILHYRIEFSCFIMALFCMRVDDSHIDCCLG